MELTEFQKQVFEFVKTRPSPGCHCAKNAFLHLHKAWEIREIDPEMAYFRCGCAEEEAATAIFQSLKRLRYPNAKKLRFRDHLHKLAVVPFIWAINKTATPFHEMGCEIQVMISEQKGKQVIYWSFIDPETKKRVKPDLPFNFTSSVNGVAYDFSHQINLLKDIGKDGEILEYLKRGPNNRNLFLYAASNGIRRIDNTIVMNFIKDQLSNVTNLLIVYLLIDTYPVHQTFVKQCLNAFIKMVGELPDEIEIELSNG